MQYTWMLDYRRTHVQRGKFWRVSAKKLHAYGQRGRTHDTVMRTERTQQSLKEFVASFLLTIAPSLDNNTKLSQHNSSVFNEMKETNSGGIIT
jgi:hypothetical protein